MKRKPSKAGPVYVLRLFVAGQTVRSSRAIQNLEKICERYLAGRHRIEVVDLCVSPGAAHDEQIIATPMLLRVEPVPARRIVGDLSRVENVLRGLDLQ